MNVLHQCVEISTNTCEVNVQINRYTVDYALDSVLEFTQTINFEYM